MSQWTAYAPSNIALIKYMGKIQASSRVLDSYTHTRDYKNRATNSSLSVTLNHLLTRVDIDANAEYKDVWQPLNEVGWEKIELSEKGTSRFIEHFKFLKDLWKIQGFYILRSANNFPSDCGLASSASSFAALTAAAAKLAMSQNKNLDLSIDQISRASRCGSGSSIRSFFGPYCVWENDRAYQVDDLTLPLMHQVVVVEDAKKMVSSSEAHLRVATSPLFEGRVQRAEARLRDLVETLNSASESFRMADWRKAFQICWDEFHDMHSLFSTSKPPFSYWTNETDMVINWAQNYWDQHQDGPIVTMDAGANVHFLTRVDQASVRAEIAREFSRFKVFTQEGPA